MIRTQIQLPEKEYRALRDAAHRSNRSMADCVREAVATYLTKAQPVEDVMSLAGRFRPKPAKDIKDHDRAWSDAILKDGAAR